MVNLQTKTTLRGREFGAGLLLKVDPGLHHRRPLNPLAPVGPAQGTARAEMIAVTRLVDDQEGPDLPARNREMTRDLFLMIKQRNLKNDRGLGMIENLIQRDLGPEIGNLGGQGPEVGDPDLVIAEVDLMVEGLVPEIVKSELLTNREIMHDPVDKDLENDRDLVIAVALTTGVIEGGPDSVAGLALIAEGEVL